MSPLPRLWIATSLTILAVLLLALATRAVPALRARGSLPTGEAQWIWKPMNWRDEGPTAFYAVRDFDLPARPRQARLLVTADEEYVLTLNGKRIGAGAWRPGAPLDVYEAGPLLLQGGNRLVVELRSSRGVGGLLLGLEDTAAHRILVGTDQAWRIFPRHQLGLVRGWLPLGGGELAHCWGIPPAGRWDRPREGPLRPPLGRLAGAPVPAVSARPAGPAGAPGFLTLYDWGREVTGYLSLGVLPAERPGVALLFTGNQPPDPLADAPAGSVLIQAGRQDWLDARPRRFRYALLAGRVRPARVAVLPVPAWAVPPEPAGPDGKGVFGIVAPPLRTPVENKVWGELQRLTSVAGRKEL